MRILHHACAFAIHRHLKVLHCNRNFKLGSFIMKEFAAQECSKRLISPSRDEPPNRLAEPYTENSMMNTMKA